MQLFEYTQYIVIIAHSRSAETEEKHIKKYMYMFCKGKRPNKKLRENNVPKRTMIITTTDKVEHLLSINTGKNDGLQH